MEETTQKQNEISIMDIIRLLLSKIKWLILVLVIGAGLGAGFGVIRTHNVEYYGTELKFYINPSKNEGSSVNSDSQYGVYGAYGKNVLNNMVELLESEAFAERLLLDENGLPTEERLTAIDNEELNQLVATANVAVGEYNAKYTTMEESLTSLNLANELVDTKTTQLDKLWSAARLENSSLPVTPETGVSVEIDNAISALNEATVNQIHAQQVYDNLYKEVKTLSKKADQAKEPALAKWRALDSTYTTELTRIVSAVSYSYYDETMDVDADDLARSFIYVNISVLNDLEYAQALRLLLIEAVPEYIVEKMPIPSGYDGTNCIRISRTDEVHRTNSGVVTKTAVKYGLILGAAALVVACIIIIVIDRSDKRLRSIEQITDVFNVPVLGVIPTFKNSQKAEDFAESKKSTEVQ
ncbi:MAG: hypothetical protein IJ329_01035 [Clostridia bacterium]|nr:hypothetical protein [Clostridia bacterium]